MPDTINVTRIPYKGYEIEIFKEGGILILNRFGVFMGEAASPTDAKEKIDTWKDKE